MYLNPLQPIFGAWPNAPQAPPIDTRKLKNFVLVKNMNKFQKQVDKGRNPGMLLNKKISKLKKKANKVHSDSTITFGKGMDTVDFDDFLTTNLTGGGAPDISKWGWNY